MRSLSCRRLSRKSLTRSQRLRGQPLPLPPRVSPHRRRRLHRRRDRRHADGPRTSAECRLLCRFSAAGNGDALHALLRRAAEKRQGTKSRDVGQRRCRGRYGDLATKLGIWSLGSIDCGDRFSAKRRCMRGCERALCPWRDKICRATAGESSAPMRAWPDAASRSVFQFTTTSLHARLLHSPRRWA